MRKNSLREISNLKRALYGAICVIVLLVILEIVYMIYNQNTESVLKRTGELNNLISQIRIDLLKSSEIEKTAVMADTDEMSRELANNAIGINNEIEIKRQELLQLVCNSGSSTEVHFVEEFKNCWDQFQKIDGVLLKFAVENTNLKASSLSTSKGFQILSIFEKDLMDIRNSSLSSGNKDLIVRLISDALVAAFKIQYMHSPHIASANDTTMDTIEDSIKKLDATVKSSLDRLNGLVPKDGLALLRDASSAYDHYMVVTAEVLRLSRQNTNIRSFELSLGRKRKVTIECDEILNGLQEVVRGKSLDAAR